MSEGDQIRGLLFLPLLVVGDRRGIWLDELFPPTQKVLQATRRAQHVLPVSHADEYCAIQLWLCVLHEF
jgi:hypothetical protein